MPLNGRFLAHRMLVPVAVIFLLTVQAGAAPFILTYEFLPQKSARQRIIAPQAGTPKKIDGILDDACWTRSISGHILSDMPEGQPTRGTIFRICRDDAALYVAFECSEPAIASVPLMSAPPRDVWPSESVQIWLSRSGGADDWRLFAVDPNGSQYDESAAAGKAWNHTTWSAKSVRSLDGWTVEIAIPLAQLGYPAPRAGDIWRINFCRDSKIANEQCSWEPTMGSRQYRPLWGQLYFGTSEQAEKASIHPAVHIYPDQWRPKRGDRTMRAVLSIDTGTTDITKTFIRFGAQFQDQATPQPDLLFLPMRSDRLSFVLDLTQFPTGPFTLFADLYDMDNALLANAITRLEIQPESPVPQGGRLQLRLATQSAKSDMASRWPITTGVALPQGALFSIRQIRLLNPNGEDIPCSGTVRSRWPGDGSIRWLGLDFQADLHPSQPQIYTLEYGQQVIPPPVRGFRREFRAARLDVVKDARVSDFEGAWWVNTGALLFTVSHDRFSGVAEAWVDVDGNGQYDWFEQILNAQAGGAGPYLVDNSGRTYKLGADPDCKVELEEWNEMRVVLRAEGRMMPADELQPHDVDMGQCVLRITAYIGQPFLRMQCSFFLNDRATRNSIKDIGIIERLDAEFARRFETICAVPELFRQNVKDTGAIYLMNLDRGRHVLHGEKEGAVNNEGTGAQNWIAAALANRGMAVTIQDMDSLYPKAFSLGPDRDFRTHFWPPFGTQDMRTPATPVNRRNIANLSFLTDSTVLDLRVPPSYAAGIKDREEMKDFNAVREMEMAEPNGIALNYDVLYFFFKNEFNAEQIAEIASLCDKRPHAAQDQESLAASGVFSDTLSESREKTALAMFRQLMKRELLYPAAGEFNFLDFRREWLPGEDRWTLENHWMGSNDDLPGALWMLYLQTADPEVFQAAMRNTRHVACMDICHEALPNQGTQADLRKRKLVGGFGAHATPMHWLGTCHVNDGAARVRGLLLAWFLTGDTMALDAVLLWTEAAARYGPPTGGSAGLAYISNLNDFLQFNYDPLLVERMNECRNTLLSVPLQPERTDVWIPGLRGYILDRRDPLATEFLRKQQSATDPSLTPPVGLLRDFEQISPDAAAQKNALLDEIAQKIEDPTFSWRDFCRYVFAAGGAE